MFGLTLRTVIDDFAVTLRALKKEELPQLVEGFQSLKVHMWTSLSFAQVLENENEWYDRTRKSETDCIWAIVPGGEEKPVGVTGLHKIDLWGSSMSGIIIWNPDWWGKGVASRSHLARTLFAADFLNRATITSSVRTQNPASLKALERVGYHTWGIEPRVTFRQGKWGDTYRLVWFNPEKKDTLFPGGVPESYKAAFAKAKNALELARKVVELP